MRSLKPLVFCVALACLSGCEDGPRASTAGSASVAASSIAPATASAAAPVPAPIVRDRSGSSIALTLAEVALLVASEDHEALFRVALPFSNESKVESIEMPGAPAQIVTLADKVLVTVRNPGLLLELVSQNGSLVEKRRVALAADAWGVAITPDGATAIVTSAWTHTVCGVDVGSMSVKWTKDVAREPRGVLVLPDGNRAYVSHLVGTELTRLDDIGSAAPLLKRVALAPAPSRTAPGQQLGAALGYALAADPDGKRLFVPRHALGALGTWFSSTSWWGAATVDVLRTIDDAGIAPPKNGRAAVFPPKGRADPNLESITSDRDPATDGMHAPLPASRWEVVTQPRAVVYRARTHTLLVASEGNDRLVELDARALEPALQPLLVYNVETQMKKPLVMPETGGAPAGIVMDATESKAYVFARSTYDVSMVSLAADPRVRTKDDRKAAAAVELADDPLLEESPANASQRKLREAAVWGRRLYYLATDAEMSSGMACAGCHPEGRDDGFTWRFYPNRDAGELYAAPEQREANSFEPSQEPPGAPRQTPMLAGRVAAVGPYGWTAESETLEKRVDVGFDLHHAYKPAGGQMHALFVATFARLGLTPPPKVTRPLSQVEQRGREIFMSNEAGCTACHDPASGYTDRKPIAVKVPERRGFVAEEGTKFKTPSLSWIVGTPPYFHNGSAGSLEQLVLGNDDRMGKTNQLSAADKAALIAFLETL